LDQARAAQQAGKGQRPEWNGIYIESLALAKLGRMAEARQAAEKLLERTASIPTEKEKRRHHHLLGELALLDGDIETAVRQLEKARSMLPLGRSGQHIPIWYSLGSAYLAGGKHDEATEYFRKIADSGFEHVNSPIEYVQSFYFLGRIHNELGNAVESREYYHRFYEFWKYGDLDRERIEEARAAAGS
jgi:tetratricopeptide (TPR) repeat protein